MMSFLKAFLGLNIIIFFSPYLSTEEISWAQHSLNNMSIDEKIGQLFMIAGYVDPDFAKSEIGNSNIIQEIDSYITQFNVGGIAFVGPSDSQSQITLTNHYQKLSKYPLLIAQDLEWGLSMRLKDGMRFPKNITLGAIEDNTLIYELGKEIGKQAKSIGVHMNLSPVLDTNTEPENIVINIRSFGNSPKLVAEKGVAMIKGLQDAGIMASAKHFPGLGDIKIDPHFALPYSQHNSKKLHEVEFYPFIEAIKAGVSSIQTEHLMLPAIDSDPSSPASLSSKIVTGILKNELGFTGLILSGALRMNALTHYFSDEEIILKAFLAGSDMLLMPQNFPKAHLILKQSLKKGLITEKEINERVLKILEMKEKLQLNKEKFIPSVQPNILDSKNGKALKKRLYQNSVHLVRNDNSLIPLNLSENSRIAYVQLGDTNSKIFYTHLSSIYTVDTYHFPLADHSLIETDRLLQNIDNYNAIILAVYPADPRRIAEIRLLNNKNQTTELAQFNVHGMTQQFIELINSLKIFQKKTIVSFFGNPFGIHFFHDFSTLIMGFEDDFDAQEASFNVMINQNNHS